MYIHVYIIICSNDPNLTDTHMHTHTHTLQHTYRHTYTCTGQAGPQVV